MEARREIVHVDLQGAIGGGCDGEAWREGQEAGGEGGTGEEEEEGDGDEEEEEREANCRGQRELDSHFWSEMELSGSSGVPFCM